MQHLGVEVPRGTQRRSKFGNSIVDLDGKRFGSKWELRRYQELLEMQSAGLIRELRHQVPFALHVATPAGDRVRIGSYEADFVYLRDGAHQVTEDTKSEPTRRHPFYQHKAKHFEAEYGLRILEVVRARRRKGRVSA